MPQEMKGQNGIIYVHDEYLEISRKTIGGFTTQGIVGDRQFYYSDINSIEYKSPTFMANGYLKIIVGGTSETNAKVGLFSSSMDSAKDPNTVIFRAFKKSTSQAYNEVHQLIMGKLKLSKSQATSDNVKNSNLDELKKLGELLNSGVLTKSEFEKEKEKLLA